LARVAEGGSRKGMKAKLAQFLRISVLSILSFSVNEVPVRAAALSFTTVLAFIPLTVILSYLAGWLGYFDLLPSLVPYVAKSLHLTIPIEPVVRSVEHAEGIGFHQVGILGSVGLLIGFYLSMSNVEEAVNQVWNVRQDRGWFGRLRRYTPFLILMAALLVLSAFVLFRMRPILDRYGLGYGFSLHLPGGNFLFGSVGLLAILWVLIFLVVRLLPNTRVRAKSALLGASAAIVLLYGLSRLLFLFPMMFIGRNQMFYGSLVIFPVALLLIYAFWIAVLFGAAFGFVHARLQDHEAPRFFNAGSSGMLEDWREALRETEALYRHPTTRSRVRPEPIATSLVKGPPKVR
jgi:membrane protein